MQTMMHAVALPRRKGLTPQRATGFLFAGLLQAGLVWALVNGLDIKVWPEPDRTIEGRVILDKTKLPPLPPPRPIETWQMPRPVAAERPVVVIETGQTGDAIHPRPPGGNGTAVTDAPPAGILATHSIPPYPPLALRLGEQGSVQLHLIISVQGVVTDATIVRSSGHDDLDQAARAWVMAHWRYRPAMRGGVPVPSVLDAVVRFDLKNAG